mmetsp:Transcript_11152/g.20876  ORF Transcript_11152/g.20876 Transcript_11152/m.20876 type:complete len:604 (+) Transcript_11152:151-1962(+)
MRRSTVHFLVLKRPFLQFTNYRLLYPFTKEDYSTTSAGINRKKRCAPSSSPVADASRYSKAWEVPVVEKSNSTKESTSLDDGLLFQSCSEAKKWKQISTKKELLHDSKRGGRIIDSTTKEDTFTAMSSNWQFKSNQMHNILKAIENHTVKHLLPNGYPHSVHPAYKRYTIYSFLGNTASTITMILSTQTLLLAVGVGQQAAAPISATLNWILKDGIGQFGGILFASKISSSSSNSIDADPKKWRMVSSLAMDCAMLTELTTSAFPQYFVLIASAANIGKNIAFLTASASRAKLHQCLSSTHHHDRRLQMADNLGDITGKATSQSIVASLLGTVIGLGISPHLLNDLFSVGMGCMALSLVNQYCTYQSLKSIPLNSLNRQRLMLLLKMYFQEINKSGTDIDLNDTGSPSNKEHQVNIINAICPERITELEGFIPFFSHDDSSNWLQIGCGLSTIAPNGAEELSRLHHPDENYVLRCQDGSWNWNKKNNMNGNNFLAKPMVYLTFVQGAKNGDILRGVFQAFTIMELLSSRGHLATKTKHNNQLCEFDENFTTSDELIMQWSYEFMKEQMDEFQNNISSAGWILDDSVKIMVESETNKRLKFDFL